MRREAGVSERAIVGKKVALSDAEIETKYTLPFVDGTWHVPFVVLDTFGSPPRLLAEKLQFDGRRLSSPASILALRPIESVPASAFDSLVHFDPWWAFRGVTGVDRAWLTAVFATNIAGPLRVEGKRFKIHDLRFSDDMDRLEVLIAKDESFRVGEFRPGDIDLLAIRPPRKAMRSSLEGVAAKAL